MENNSSVPEAENSSGRGLMQAITWLLKGFIYPCFSGKFYRKAARKSVLAAIGFLMIFALVQTSITTFRIANATNGGAASIKAAYETWDIPTVHIEDGIASTESQQPFILAGNGKFYGIDTTGSTQKIDPEQYSSGFLLSRTDLQTLYNGSYRIIPLKTLHSYFGNPLVLDEEHVIQIWNKITLWLNILLWFGLYTWNTLVRLVYIALLGLVVWAVVAMASKKTGFSPILITGIYAAVPTIYIVSILGEIGVHFTGLYSIFQLIIWAVALGAVFKADPETTDRIDPEPAVNPVN